MSFRIEATRLFELTHTTPNFQEIKSQDTANFHFRNNSITYTILIA
jgi:hypothetical protein